MHSLTDLCDDRLRDRALASVQRGAGMAEVRRRKSAHCERLSGMSRSAAELDAISAAAYRICKTYAQSEALYGYWASAPVPAERAVAYLRARIEVREALLHWEPRFLSSTEETSAALAMLGGLRDLDPPT